MSGQIENTETNYSNVKWYRKDWGVSLFCLFMPPVGLFILLTGEIYQKKHGMAELWPKRYKYFSIGWCILVIVGALVRAVKDIPPE
jgi:hypothetical protein